MMKAAIVFLVLGLFSVLLGANGIGGLSIEIGKLLLLAFIILTFVGFLLTLLSGNKSIGS
jgi:uncharacterized membrane protein YtjA (UPF0391 family)